MYISSFNGTFKTMCPHYLSNWQLKKKSKISDKITYVQHYNTESIHLYYFGIHSDNDHIIHKKAS